MLISKLSENMKNSMYLTLQEEWPMRHDNKLCIPGKYNTKAFGDHISTGGHSQDRSSTSQILQYPPQTWWARGTRQTRQWGLWVEKQFANWLRHLENNYVKSIIKSESWTKFADSFLKFYLVFQTSTWLSRPNATPYLERDMTPVCASVLPTLRFAPLERPTPSRWPTK